MTRQEIYMLKQDLDDMLLFLLLSTSDTIGIVTSLFKTIVVFTLGRRSVERGICAIAALNHRMRCSSSTVVTGTEELLANQKRIRFLEK